MLWVGSLRSRDPRKGLDTLLEAMERGWRDGGPTLALAGALGPEADRLAARGVATARAAGPLRTGGGPDLASLYRQAAVVALPSTHEGFGLTALEAMACGAPLVASAVGNLPQLTLDVAVLVPPSDPAALADGIESVLTEPVRAARMRHAGVDRASGYTWERTAALTAAVYEEVARHSSGADLDRDARTRRWPRAGGTPLNLRAVRGRRRSPDVAPRRGGRAR